MERFDKQFNESDPETGRPFSGGHPDGVWIIAIIYSLFILGALAGCITGLAQVIQGDLKGLSVALASVVSLVLYAGSIVQLFKRSIVAIALIGFLSACFLVGTLGGAAFQNEQLTPILAVATIVHIYILYYVFGLKKDGLLK